MVLPYLFLFMLHFFNCGALLCGKALSDPLSLMLNHLQVDIIDFNGSFLARVRDFAGANPIILVVTKVIFWITQN